MKRSADRLSNLGFGARIAYSAPWRQQSRHTRKRRSAVISDSDLHEVAAPPVIHFSTASLVHSNTVIDQHVYLNHPQAYTQGASLGRPGAGLIGACSHAGPGSYAAVDRPAIVAVTVVASLSAGRSFARIGSLPCVPGRCSPTATHAGGAVAAHPGLKREHPPSYDQNASLSAGSASTIHHSATRPSRTKRQWAA